MNQLYCAVSLWEIEQDLTGVVSEIFSSLMNLVSDLLTANPKAWAESHGIWSTIENLNNSVISVACQLVVLFFLIGFIENTANIREQMTPFHAAIMLVTLIFSQFLVVHSMDIILWMFNFATNLAGLTHFNNFSLNHTGLAVHIYDMSTLSNVVFLFPTILYLIVVPACGAMIVILALKRLFEVYLAVPYGSLAFSTMSGSSRHLSEIAPGFIKYMLSILLRAFSLGLALNIGGRLLLFQGGGFITFSDINVSNHLLPATLKIIQNIINVIILTVLCRMSEEVGSKSLRLDR